VTQFPEVLREVETAGVAQADEAELAMSRSGFDRRGAIDGFRASGGLGGLLGAEVDELRSYLLGLGYAPATVVGL